ncbi:hypothetical protein BZG36_00087 [Bifiguratus adelaidae]|uniref:Nudix hydrolase domain-containing protein n=1 Tax=Bifiguratus adelaidae TaxID=1938954 RepID=A0A261Y8E7_9FUNG|nr:hypothetical protein BZG36_00087 [Bifiguratus adelaidae]
MSLEARTGRNKQVYDESLARQVAGCIPYDAKTGLVILISSRRHPKRFVYPKGGWENDETVEQAALRETWEEAGLRGRITAQVGRFDQPSKQNPNVTGTVHWVYAMEVNEVLDEWPEQSLRIRQSMTIEEALACIGKKQFMQDALRAFQTVHARQFKLDRTHL